MNHSQKSGASSASSEVVAESYLTAVKPELMEILPAQFEVINVDVRSVVSTVLGALPKLRPLRERMPAELPRFDLVRFDKLEAYAHALTVANAQYVTATAEPDDLARVFEEAVRLREVLLSEVKTLVARGMVRADRVDDLQGAVGYKNVAGDLFALIAVLRDMWPSLQGKVLLTEDELNQAQQHRTRLLRVVGERAQAPAIAAAATELRLRAFTQLLSTYEAAQRALIYLLGDEDEMNRILPSLRPGRPRKKDVGEVPATDGAPKPAVVPSPPVTAVAAHALSLVDGDDEGSFVK